jgi:hypothetical protein
MNIYFTTMNSSRGENPDVALQTLTSMTEVTYEGVLAWLMAIDESADEEDLVALIKETLDIQPNEDEILIPMYGEKGIYYLPSDEHCYYFKEDPFTLEDIQWLVENDWGMEWEGAFDNMGNEILPDVNGYLPILEWES